ncbi:fasciclin domain-containing protein [Pseudocolwellia sp. HL-MZ19]|uniref:fasciclin domain-containing protein n=1 Tax=Pseudocolwellia sp. HL-MZ19 TaxID=3400846 RepID=UPI003CF9C51D
MNVGMFNLSFKRMLLLPILTCVLAACGGGNDNKVAVEESGGQVIVPAEEMNILQVLEADTSFSRFLGSLELAGLTDRFADTSRQFTIFVPNNSAFDLLGDISGLTNDQLNSLLLYHVLVIRWMGLQLHL